MAEITLIHHIPANIDKVFPFFNDIDRFVAVHPVIYKAEATGTNQYRLFEKLDLKFCKVSFSYMVSIETSVPGKQVIMFARIRKGVTLRLQFDFIADNNTTHIHETVTFNAPAVICPIFLKFLTRQHQLLVAKVREEVGKQDS